MSPLSTGTRAAIVIAVLMIASSALTMAPAKQLPDSLLSITRVCQSGALYLCDQYVAPPYTVTYNHRQLRINGMLYENYDCHEDDIEKRLANKTYSGHDVWWDLQRRSTVLRNHGLSQSEVCGRLLARADSLANDNVAIESNTDTSFFVVDRKRTESIAVIIWSDAQLEEQNDRPPPGITSLERLVSAFQAGRPVFLFDRTRRGPASNPSDDSTFVALWHRTQGPDAKAAERDLESLSYEYRSKRLLVLDRFCRNMLDCLKGTGGGPR